MEINEQIQEIKTYMKANKITYDDLAERSGLSISTIKKIFAGISQYPRIDTITTIRNALGLDEKKNPPDDLSEGEKLLIELFNRVPDEKKQLVLDMIRLAVNNQ